LLGTTGFIESDSQCCRSPSFISGYQWINQTLAMVCMRKHTSLPHPGGHRADYNVYAIKISQLGFTSSCSTALSCFAQNQFSHLRGCPRPVHIWLAHMQTCWSSVIFAGAIFVVNHTVLCHFCYTFCIGRLFAKCVIGRRSTSVSPPVRCLTDTVLFQPLFSYF
jgi:hypothetical protein